MTGSQNYRFTVEAIEGNHQIDERCLFLPSGYLNRNIKLFVEQSGLKMLEGSTMILKIERLKNG